MKFGFSSHTHSSVFRSLGIFTFLALSFSLRRHISCALLSLVFVVIATPSSGSRRSQLSLTSSRGLRRHDGALGTLQDDEDACPPCKCPRGFYFWNLTSPNSLSQRTQGPAPSLPLCPPLTHTHIFTMNCMHAVFLVGILSCLR